MSNQFAEVLQQCGYSLSESAALRLHAGSPGIWTEMVQRSILRVFPNGSRVDSSNFSPLEFWNAGVPMGKFSREIVGKRRFINRVPTIPATLAEGMWTCTLLDPTPDSTSYLFSPFPFPLCVCVGVRVIVALNFQTPGLMMDLYDGKFRQNGGCGYVLKPAMMRQPGFSVPSSLRESAPISPPQLLRIRVHKKAFIANICQFFLH